jgi:hypothetical protein
MMRCGVIVMKSRVLHHSQTEPIQLVIYQYLLPSLSNSVSLSTISLV